MLLLTLCLLAADLVTEPAPDLDALARQVAREREEIEQLAADVDAARQAARAELLALEAQHRTLQAELEGLELRRAAVQAEITQQRAALGRAGVGHAADDDAVAAGILRARALLAATVPFDLPTRTAQLDQAAAALTTFGAGAAAPLLWRHLENEQTLSAQLGRGRQPVQIGDKRVLADTLHVGLALLFFKTGGGTVGFATQRGGGWQWQVADDPPSRTRVLALFEAARHGSPRGVFLVPNPLQPVAPLQVDAPTPRGQP